MYSKTIEILNKEDDLSYYLLGAFITDGCVKRDKSRINTRKSNITSCDLDWLQEINSFINEEGKIRPKYEKGEMVAHQIWFHNSPIYYWLVDHECVEKKSLTVKMPPVPAKYLPDFVRGCIDGDGTITSCIYSKKNKNKTKEWFYTKSLSYICSSSFDFLKGLDFECQKFDIHGSLFEVHKKPSMLDGRLIVPKNPHYRLSFSDKSALKFVSWAYYDGHKISMPRKRNLAQELIQRYSI